MSLQQEAQRQFAVVARLREGVRCTLSSPEIILDIRDQLSQFQTMFDIICSSPNFIIETASTAFQLQLLACRVLDVQELHLDLLPWCPEYESENLPWIVADDTDALSVGPVKPYMANLVCQPTPLRNYALGLITGQIQTASRPGPGRGRIHIDMVDAHGPVPALDLSYMLVLELRDFYYQRYHGFVNCRTSCQQIYDIVHSFCAKLTPALEDIYAYTQSFQGASSRESLQYITNFGDGMRLQALDVPKELAVLDGIICPVVNRVRPPISLTRFKDDPSIYQMDGPDYPTVHLRAILNEVTKKFRRTTVSVTTEPGPDGNFHTAIEGTTFKRRFAVKSLGV